MPLDLPYLLFCDLELAYRSKTFPQNLYCNFGISEVHKKDVVSFLVIIRFVIEYVRQRHNRHLSLLFIVLYRYVRFRSLTGDIFIRKQNTTCKKYFSSGGVTEAKTPLPLISLSLHQLISFQTTVLSSLPF